MKYAVNPQKALSMLPFCDEGENIYEVTIRFYDGSIGLSYSIGRTPEEVEARALDGHWCKSAVARLIIMD